MKSDNYSGFIDRALSQASGYAPGYCGDNRPLVAIVYQLGFALFDDVLYVRCLAPGKVGVKRLTGYSRDMERRAEWQRERRRQKRVGGG